MESEWQAVTDPESGDIYYWNTVTGVTSWDSPFSLDDDDNDSATAAVKEEESPETVTEELTKEEKPVEELSVEEQQRQYEEYVQQYYAQYGYTTTQGQEPMMIPHEQAPVKSQNVDYAQTGFFNTRTGRYEARPDDPDAHSIHVKSARQMGAFFNYDQWAQERGRKYIDSAQLDALDAENERNRKPTKREMAVYRLKKKEKTKKKRAWLHT